MRLNKEERITASAIYRSLCQIKENCNPGTLEYIKKDAKAMLASNGFSIDYVEIADAGDLSLVSQWNGRQGLVALIAAYLNDVRLIDNMLLNQQII